MSESATIDTLIFRPTPGPQEAALASEADVMIYGGAAGGGKTFELLLDQARWAMSVRGFAGVIFRRTYPQIMAPGALWDESMKMFPYLGGSGVRSDARWVWPDTGSWIKFSHLQHEKEMHDWQGAQLAIIAFDELTHFSETVFWYLSSRLRTMCGIKPYLRATCNPEPGSWVARLISWWLDPKTGFPIPERAGVLRWFIRKGDEMIWADNREDLPEEMINGKKVGAMSFTFIPAKVTDNIPLLEANPEYMAQLRALPFYERQLLLDGNWKVRREGGMRYKREWFGEPARPPQSFVRVLRYWDRASTKPSKQNPDPDWTRGVKLGEDKYGTIWVLDVASIRDTPLQVRTLMARTSAHDQSPDECECWMEQDPASAGKAEKLDLARDLAEYAPHFFAPSGSKWTRSAPASAAAEAGRVRLAIGDWNDAFLDELEAFVDEDAHVEGKKIKVPPGYHDDQNDGFTGGFNLIAKKIRGGISGGD